jgi:hypothetical protein
MNIRETAVHVTAKKIAYRQTREGNVVSFAMDPQDVPDKLATDPIGTSYMLALVEVDDATGQPKGGDAHATATRLHETAPRPPLPKPEGGARKSPAQVAGYLCTLPSFWKFLRDRHGYNVRDTADAADAVRKFCCVEHRSEITPDNPFALAEWSALRGEFGAWEKEVEVVG